MKKHILLVCGCFCLLLAFNGCSEQKPEEITYEPVKYENVQPDEQLKEALNSAIVDYLQALEQHQYYALLSCTNDSLPLNRNETAFNDFTLGLASAKAEDIQLNDIHQTGNSYLLKVKYSLTFSGSFTDINGEAHEPGTYSYYELFTITEEDGQYRISSIETTGEG